MKNILMILLLFISFSCKESDFENAYTNPAKIAETTIENQFAGYLVATKNYLVPNYGNYYYQQNVVMRYNQSTGWVNTSNQYYPDDASMQDIWFSYYNSLAQFAELQNVYNASDADTQESKKIFIYAAKLIHYAFTQRMVDLFGSIPFTDAGRTSANGGDYTISFAKFDSPESIYEFMLSDIKSISEELRTLTLNNAIVFNSKDLMYAGDLDKWNRFANSLRLNMLNRVASQGPLSASASTELASLIGSASLIESIDQNAQLNVYSWEDNDWNANITNGIKNYRAGKKMIDQLEDSNDPRLGLLFEKPRITIKDSTYRVSEYLGYDPMAVPADQDKVRDYVSIFNESTFRYNRSIPGPIITAAQVDFVKAEYYLNKGEDAMAKASYENGIKNSIRQFEKIRSISNDTRTTAVPQQSIKTDAEISEFVMGKMVSWDAATSDAEKLKLIATQKWIHFNVYQPYENWAELRRLGSDVVGLEFIPEPAFPQKLPPNRFFIPSNERTYNSENYNLIKDQDDVNNKLFWAK